MNPRQTDSREVVREALELRHAVEQLAERCRRLYEESNELVERLRGLRAALPRSATSPRTATPCASGPPPAGPHRD